MHHIFKGACTEQWLNFQLTATPVPPAEAEKLFYSEHPTCW